MNPIIYRVIARYAPYITLPIAAVVGVIGYYAESYLSDKYTPYQQSISKTRAERLLHTEPQTDSLKDNKFVPNSVFLRNLSPSLQDK